MTDVDALLRIKQSLNNPEPLDSWKLGTIPCDDVIRWVGIVCNKGIVTNLHLKSMSLSGNIDLTALSEMAGLRIISLENNSFSGPIPEFNRLGSLKGLYLSMNQYSGKIPHDYFTDMTSMKKIWFDGNKFTGEIPSSIAELPNLVELHLEDNQFSGPIPHGNLKSSNILLNPNFQPLIVDFGRISHKCDVYCFGIIILEILTCKFPSQYVNSGQGGTDLVQWVKSAIHEQREVELLDQDITGSSKYIGEMKKLLHIAASCTENDPEARLEISEVVNSIENIQGGDEKTIAMFSSFGDGYDDAASTLTDASYMSMTVDSKINNNNNNNEQTQRKNNDSFGYRVS